MTVEATTVVSHNSRRRRSWRQRRLPTWLTAILWVVTSGLLVVLAMRLFAWDALEPFAVLNDLTAFVYLPAWIILAVAIVWWRPALVAGALVVVVGQLVLLLPELTAAHPPPSWTATAPVFRLLDANVYYDNPSMAGYAAQIEASRPQLVTMEEATPRLVGQLERSGALAGLPYRVEISRDDPSAFFVASRYPLTDEQIAYDYGRPLVLQLTVQRPGGRLPLWVVHTTAPLPSPFAEWKGQLATINRLLEARGPDGLLMVGDFNATWGSKGFRALLDEGLTDGAAARGHAMSMTWSQLMHHLPPMVRIDHVLTGSGVAVTSITTGSGPGSDHRDLEATVAVRP
jgi:endonuclease/exonuclease/phosphatase (EEP) superfamily protein YafD